ncbi:MAG: SpoIIIAH-like family protein [Clostridia bacterium]|nr:SpoIIIAH-like family protein [Clostridia bacterium]
MSKKKKIIILSVMVALLLVTGVVNVVLNNNLTSTSTTSVQQVSTTTTQSFYSLYRTERESTRQQELQFYEAISASTTASDEAKEEAEANKLALIAQMEKELITEGIIIGKGFDDAIVTQSSANVNVFVKSAELNVTEVATITDVVREQLGVDIDKIIIIPSEA